MTYPLDDDDEAYWRSVPAREPLPELLAPSSAPYAFAAKLATKQHFRDMLGRHTPGARIPEPDASDLQWLVAMHPYAAEKIGPGIDLLC